MTDAVLDEVLAELDVDDPTCEECGRPMPTRGQWDRADDAERADLLEDGYVSPVWHGCGMTPQQRQQAPRIERNRQATAAFWEAYGAHYAEHATMADLARAIGYHPTHVTRKVRNASRGEP